MKEIYLIKATPLFLCLLFNYIGQSQNLYFNQDPDFQFSYSGQYATGLGIADIDNDGWKDIIIANGNDMARQKVEIYYNNGDGTFPVDPDWESSDIDYHGHLAVGDLNGDGWNDIVICVYIGAAGFSQPGKLKIYFNNSGTIETTPSFVSDTFYTFSCALGDADGDGDLDIASTSGEAYNEIFEHAKIFTNNNGAFNTTPDWTAVDSSCTYDVEFADFDRNGFMDIVYGGELTPSHIYLSDNMGNIDEDADWYSAGNALITNSLDVGFINNNQNPDVVISNNNQMGGDGKLKCYNFNSTIPAMSTHSWESEYFGYQSGVYLYDLNNDNQLDLLLGGWWRPIKIYYGTDTAFESTATYTSSTGSVVEAILLSDLDKDNIETFTDTIIVSQDSTSIIYVSKKPVENYLNIKKNNIPVTTSRYCFVPGKNWISLKEKAQQNDTIIIEYEYSKYMDMVISNWDGPNYIFYNQKDSGNYVNNIKSKKFRIFPNPSKDNIIIELNIPEDGMVQIFDTKGHEILQDIITPRESKKIIDISEFAKGIYFVRIKSKKNVFTEKIITIQ